MKGKIMENLPKKLKYFCSSVAMRKHGVGYETESGYKILFSMNYTNPFYETLAKEIVKRWNAYNE